MRSAPHDAFIAYIESALWGYPELVRRARELNGPAEVEICDVEGRRVNWSALLVSLNKMIVVFGLSKNWSKTPF